MSPREGRGNTRKRTLADGTVVFDVYGRRAGKKKHIGVYPTKKAAERALEEDAVLQRQIRRGDMPPEVDTRRTFEAVAREWLMGPKRSRSVETHTSKLELHVLPRLASVGITAIKVGDLEKLQGDLLLSPGLAPRTVHLVMQSVASVCRYAFDRGYIPRNPAAGFDLQGYPERAYHWIRTRAEIERLLLAVGDPHRTMFAVLVLTGMRRDELMHLQWVDVDLETRLVCIQRGRHGMPKGGKFRYVPICDALLPVLKRWRLLSGDVAGLVFPGRRGRVRAGQPVSRAFKDAAKVIGLDPQLRLHDLRHTYASHFVRDGGDIFRLSRYLGHQSVVITERTYAHLAPEDYSRDWGRVAVRVPLEDAKVIDLAGERREMDDLGVAILDGGRR